MTTKCNCSVTSCAHNSEHCCCKNSILVDGSNAKDKEETCCASYDEIHENSFKNTYESPDEKLRIDCSVIRCQYNHDQMCAAEHIDISTCGSSGSETECSTFRAKM